MMMRPISRVANVQRWGRWEEAYWEAHGKRGGKTRWGKHGVHWLGPPFPLRMSRLKPRYFHFSPSR